MSQGLAHTVDGVGVPRLRLLDLFCCAGGAGRGYADAGFDVVGVDLDYEVINNMLMVTASGTAVSVE